MRSPAPRQTQILPSNQLLSVMLPWPFQAAVARPRDSGWLSIGILLVAMVLISGCSTTSVPPDVQASSDDFRLDVGGKLGVRHDGGGFSANLSYQQVGDRYVIELWGPLGQGRTRIVGDAGSVTVTNGSGSVIEGGDPELVMQRQLGWSLPLSVLRYWAAGRAAPDAAIRSGGGTQNTRFFEQLGWRVEARRLSERLGAQLPALVVLEKPGLTARLALRQWREYAPAVQVVQPIDPRVGLD